MSKEKRKRAYMVKRIISYILFLFILGFFISIDDPISFLYIPGLAMIVMFSLTLTAMRHKEGDGSQKELKNLRKSIILSTLLVLLIALTQGIYGTFEFRTEISEYELWIVLIHLFYGFVLYCIVDTFIE